MQISLDTNVWIFGILGLDEYCEHILLALSRFELIVPDQIRAELDSNLSDGDMKQFYRFMYHYEAHIDFQAVPDCYIEEFTQKGLKKGDAEIGAFCEWREIDVFVSENRHFLKELSPERHFRVMSPEIFYQTFCQ